MRQYLALNFGNRLRALRWQDIGAFLFFAAVFAIPSGYSLGAVLLFVGSLLTFRASDLKALDLHVWLVIGAFVLYALFWGMDGLLRGEGVRELDRPIRFLFAAFVLARIYRVPPSTEFVFFGISLGALTAGFVAAYEYYWVGMNRANGFMPTNSFGMLAALYAGLSLCVLQFARFGAGYRCLSLLAALGGVSASAAALLSGSRGAFLTLAGVGIWLFIRVVLRYDRWSLRLGLTISILLVIIAVYNAPGTPVKQRIDAAVHSATAYVIDSERVGRSIPARFDMWQGGLILFLEKPLLGWGESGYQAPLSDLVERGVIEDDHASGRHLHNQFLHVLTSKGFIGVLILAVLLIAPVFYIKSTATQNKDTKNKNADPSDSRAFIYLVVVAYFLGGLTRVPMEHHSGVMVYAFCIAILLGLHRAQGPLPKPRI